MSKYAPSFISNLRDEKSRFLTGVSDLVKEEYHTIMLHRDMTLCKLMVYAQSIEESKLRRRGRDAKRGRTDELGQPSVRRRLQIKMFLMILRPSMREVVVLKLINLLVHIVGSNFF